MTNRMVETLVRWPERMAGVREQVRGSIIRS
jgi:hypothetical protein